MITAATVEQIKEQYKNSLFRDFILSSLHNMNPFIPIYNRSAFEYEISGNEEGGVLDISCDFLLSEEFAKSSRKYKNEEHFVDLHTLTKTKFSVYRTRRYKNESIGKLFCDAQLKEISQIEKPLKTSNLPNETRIKISLLEKRHDEPVPQHIVGKKQTLSRLNLIIP